MAVIDHEFVDDALASGHVSLRVQDNQVMASGFTGDICSRRPLDDITVCLHQLIFEADSLIVAIGRKGCCITTGCNRGVCGSSNLEPVRVVRQADDLDTGRVCNLTVH